MTKIRSAATESADAVQTPKSEIAYLRVKGDIVSGRLPDDKPLRVEALQSTYDIGTTPIRDALARLEVEGFVQLRPNRGYYTTRLSVEDFSDLMYSRRILERELLARSIERGGEDWEVAVVTAHHVLKRCKIDLSDPDLARLDLWEERHIAFHVALLSASGAKRLLAFYRRIYDHLRRHQKSLELLPTANRAQSGEADALRIIEQLERSMAIEEHTRLMDAALARDTEKALQLIDAHVGLTPWQMQPLREVGR